jgi:hypothetical protein
MKISGRLALAMVFLVAVTSCVVGAFACYFVAEAPPGAVLVPVISAALAGGAIAAALAIGFADSVMKLLLKSPPPASEAEKAGAETEQARA